MKRFGLYTITDYLNYGNRLQNYAGQEILKAFGCEVESIVNIFPESDETRWEFLLKRIKNALSQSPVNIINNFIKKTHDRKNRGLYEQCKKSKAISFKKFSEKYIVESKFIVSKKNIPADINERYDFCFVGSDQIWNPNIRYASPLDFLTFVSPEKRIAFSPSFGVSQIPVRYFEKYKTFLNEMAFLSVREERGAQIIREISGKNAQVLVDPTLVLTKDQWLAIAKTASNRPKTNYLLTYFIGEISKKRMKVLQNIASIRNLEIIQLASLNDPLRYDADPAEFIDYIKNAEIVCTDSFHSCIFSIIMERPFVVFEREGKSAVMSSRLETLLGKLKLQNRWLQQIKCNEDFFQMDFSHVNEIIEFERELFFNYLRKALNLQ